MNAQQREPGCSNESKKVLHLNALLLALQYIDDLINNSEDGYVTLDMLQTHQLPKLDNIYNLNELKYHFQQLQMNKVYEQLQERALNNYQKVLDVFVELTRDETFYQWFTVRVDERMHAAYNYYYIIRFGMCFTFIAARLHANLLSNTDLELLESEQQTPFIQINADSYGGLLSEDSMVKKATIFIQRASYQEIDILGSTAYNLLRQKPEPYQSVQECLRDFLLIGMNCKIYNQKHPDLCKISNSYSKQVSDLFSQKFERQFLYPLIYNQTSEELIELQKRLCISGEQL